MLSKSMVGIDKISDNDGDKGGRLYGTYFKDSKY